THSDNFLRPSAVTQSCQGAGSTTSRNEQSLKIRMPGQDRLCHFAGDVGILKCRLRLQKLKVVCMLAKVGAEAALIRFLAAITVVAHKNADLARPFANIVEGPARGATDFPCIEAHI